MKVGQCEISRGVENVVIHLKSGDGRAVLSGDVLHHPLQLVRPEWSSRACEDKVGHVVSHCGAFAYRLAANA